MTSTGRASVSRPETQAARREPAELEAESSVGCGVSEHRALADRPGLGSGGIARTHACGIYEPRLCISVGRIARGQCRVVDRRHAQSGDGRGCRRDRVVAGARGCGEECGAAGAGHEQRCDSDRPDRPFHTRILTPAMLPFDRLRLGRVAAVRGGKRECKSGSLWRARMRSRRLACLHEGGAACTHEDAHAVEHVTSVAPPGAMRWAQATLPSGARCSARLCADSGGKHLALQQFASCHARTRD